MSIYNQVRWAFGPEYNQKQAQLIDGFYIIAQRIVSVFFKWEGNVSNRKGEE
jgi:hypothetical protein